MILVELQKHFPARWPEWFMAGVAIVWGCYVNFHPELFTQSATREAFAGLDAMAGSLPPSAVWGLSPVFLGIIRAAALFVNGQYTRTPMIRLGMSFASAFIWTQVVIGLMKSGLPNTGLIAYGSYVVLDIVSAYRAATDTVYAEKARHELRLQEESRGRRTCKLA